MVAHLWLHPKTQPPSPSKPARQWLHLASTAFSSSALPCGLMLLTTCVTSGFQTRAVQLVLGLHACLASSQNAPLSLPTVSRKPSSITQGRTDGFSTLTLIHSLLLTSLSEHIFNPFHRHMTECVLLAGSLQALAQWSREGSRPISGRETRAGFIRKQGVCREASATSGKCTFIRRFCSVPGCSDGPGRFFRDEFTTLVLRSVVQIV